MNAKHELAGAASINQTGAHDRAVAASYRQHRDGRRRIRSGELVVEHLQPVTLVFV